MNVLFAASELAPFAKTGGLADVAGSLPRALDALGVRTAAIMPLYRSCRSHDVGSVCGEFDVPVGNLQVRAVLRRSKLPRSNVPLYFVEQPGFFERDDPTTGHGLYQYRLPNGRMQDYPDNASRYIFFNRAILEALPYLEVRPQLIHANDWQTGLIPVYLKTLYAERPGPGQGIRSVFTIHNLAYQGTFWHWDMTLTGLDWSLFSVDQLEFYGRLSLLKGGVVFSDAVTTVSPKYAEEIQTSECGCGMEGTLSYHRHKLMGIVNGVDYDEWNPGNDSHIPVSYEVADAGMGKAGNKATLQRRLGLPERRDVFLLGMVTRLVDQKGLDLLHSAAQELLRWDIQLAILGTGDLHYHLFLQDLRACFPQKIGLSLEFSESLAHLIEAGADAFLMPSRYEPSGLNQLYSLKYGAVPIVRGTGGLANTVCDYTAETLARDEATGFVFQEYSATSMLEAIRRALCVFRDQPEVWQRIRSIGMRQDWSWNRSARAYQELYARLLA